ncbi:hypothetical protein BU25DRAFT_352773 [Macroventuria anomochaeta]|uniref:Uncharacterized protein n=1 Tax=Macroventuria anomochaeta TaxID=301207 RepID=A0ACB6RJL7_9PLEO|nr:uncharacterized protein BU25DRAFT_352773 [Macroventuria anomochaeta]KAF2622191.1 hypothetical protein BU25DRAFT_352773 [Macroventuria anomochaeta]
MIALSLCLGLNLLGSLENYAGILRWSLLSRRYVSLETFDLILGLEKLSNVVKLMVISLPLVRRWKYLQRFGWFKVVRQDGSRWTWLVCLIWLGINIGSQVLIALSSLFYPMDASISPLLTHGSVVIADLTRWQPVEDPETKQSLDFEKAWMLGMEAIAYTDYMPNDTQKDLSILSGTPLYKYEDSYGYRFFNRNPIHQYSDYFLSNRIIYARATCDELDVKEGIVDDDSTFSIEGKLPTATNWTKYYLPEYAGGALTWMASVPEYCGARCTNFTVVQPALKSYNITETSLFLCNSTVSMVEWGVDGPDIGIGNDTDAFAAFGSDDWARTASGSIGWTGIPTIGWEDIQWRTYTQGSKWSPVSVMNESSVADILMRFTIGAIAAFDDHGVRHNITGTVPAQGQQLNVDWSYMLSILGGICFMQFAAFCCLVLFANRTIIRDESYFSMAMLLSPVIGRIGKDSGRMNMSGDEIKQDTKLRYEKIQYSYREGKDGGPHQVDILFYGRDSRESRKSWAAGIYS